ncbi:Polysaccharide deacetylase [Botrimarina hoheduenensis]|uniref:Polysaccharide deacetylase n=2 Tax=Botrimarina hoheduenensis TaxID=2528000 RepID=A0A5C5WFA0_9BACT|nr:Polysaccharide deacetylase [Botrimarina hoheduenensis]
MRAYACMTGTLRGRLVNRLARSGDAPICGLFYHRVADTTPNDWTIGVEAFRRQIDWLAERFDVVSLAEAHRRLIQQDSKRPAVVITFDDGYADNCAHAVPMLIDRGLPFTYFVTTENIRNQSPFPHDKAAGAPLKPNTLTELRTMADQGVEIGAHTLTHPNLGECPPRQIREEIVGSIDQVRQWIGRDVRSFAFPYGFPINMTPLGMQIAREAGIRTICSAYGAYNIPSSTREYEGALHFRRMHADPEWSRFINWMTFDPRKLHAPEPINDTIWLGGEKPYQRLHEAVGAGS